MLFDIIVHFVWSRHLDTVDGSIDIFLEPNICSNYVLDLLFTGRNCRTKTRAQGTTDPILTARFL